MEQPHCKYRDEEIAAIICILKKQGENCVQVDEEDGQKLTKKLGYKVEKETIKYGKYPNASNTGFDIKTNNKKKNWIKYSGFPCTHTHTHKQQLR